MWKLEDFGLKIGTFPRLLVVTSYPCRIGTLSHLLWSTGSHVISEAYLNQFSFTTQKVNIGLVVNFKTMQQPASDLSSNQRYTHRAIGIELA